MTPRRALGATLLCWALPLSGQSPVNAADVEESRRTLERVRIAYASEASLQSLRPGEGFQPAGPGVWTGPHSPGLTEVNALLEIHNGIDSPITQVGIKVTESGGSASLLMFCLFEGPAALMPGETRPVICRGSDRTERVDDAVKALAERRYTPIAANSFYSHAGNVYTIEPRYADPAGASTLEPQAPAPTIAPSRSHAELAPPLLAILTFVALVVSGVMAARVEESDARLSTASLLATAVLLVSVIGLAAMAVIVRPGAGYEALLAFVAFYYGGVPALILLACLWGSVAGGPATRWRTFAAWFGTLAGIAVGITFAVATS